VLTLKYTVILIGLLFAMPIARAESDPEAIVLARKFMVHSDVLNEDRSYWVSLPADYELSAAAGRKYPVLYLLDGIAHLNVVSGTVHHLSSYTSGVQMIPGMIVVALVNTHRSRDFTPTHMSAGPYSQDSGGARAFLRFMKEELVPEIESHYRASSERTLVGHSLGGLLALCAFVDQPELFRNYIAIDPSLWWDNEALIKRFRLQPARKFSEPIHVFVAMANDGVNKRPHEHAIHGFESILKTRANDSLRVQYRYFADETHLSVPLIAVYYGLRFAYGGYQKPEDPPAGARPPAAVISQP
jgi:predicted alpha/beta superfamily hydrolase